MPPAAKASSEPLDSNEIIKEITVKSSSDSDVKVRPKHEKYNAITDSLGANIFVSAEILDTVWPLATGGEPAKSRKLEHHGSLEGIVNNGANDDTTANAASNVSKFTGIGSTKGQIELQQQVETGIKTEGNAGNDKNMVTNPVD